MFPLKFDISKLAEGLWTYKGCDIRGAAIWHGKRIGHCNTKEEKKQAAQILSGTPHISSFGFLNCSLEILTKLLILLSQVEIDELYQNLTKDKKNN